MTKRCLLMIIGVMLMMWTSVAFANEVTVQGSGANKNAALNDAFRNAIEQAVGTLVKSETLMNNYQIVKDQVYTKSQGFVTGYKVIDEATSGGVVTLTVRVNVDTAPNSELMNQLTRFHLIEVMLNNPRIGVVIPEYFSHFPNAYNETYQTNDAAAATQIMNVLQQKGFTQIMDVGQTEELKHSNMVRAAIDGDANEFISWGMNQGLEYLVVGKGISRYAGELQNSGIFSCRASLDVRIIKVNSGQVLATQSVTLGGVDGTPETAGRIALEKAGKKMGDYLVKQLMTYATNPEKMVRVVFKNVNDYDKVMALDSNLRNISGVKNVYLRKSGNGMAEFDVSYTGLSQNLASEFSNIGASVTEVSDSAIRAVVQN